MFYILASSESKELFLKNGQTHWIFKSEKKLSSKIFYICHLGHEVLVVAGGEELVDEEGPGHQDEEEGVTELGLKFK